jgi:hypothetical protein
LVKRSRNSAYKFAANGCWMSVWRHNPPKPSADSADALTLDLEWTKARTQLEKATAVTGTGTFTAATQRQNLLQRHEGKVHCHRKPDT